MGGLPLFFRRRLDVPQCGPKTQRTVPAGQIRRNRQPLFFQAPKKVSPAIGVLAEPVHDAKNILVAVLIRANNYQHTVEAEKALVDFEAEWGHKYPSIAPSWRRAWQEVIPFFAFPPAVRKIIYTTNTIESLNRVIRKTTKTRDSFSTDDAATKLIYLAIRSFDKSGRCVREWVAARNQFAILYPERFNR
jgi:transposase-like protein